MTLAEFHHLLAYRGRGDNRPIVMQPVAAKLVRLPAVPSPLERKFANLWALMGGPALQREYRFAPPRRWRFDFAHVDSKTAIELEGGVYGTMGRHVTPKGFQDDCIKYNQAASMGYAVFRMNGKMITRENLQPIIERCGRKAR